MKDWFKKIFGGMKTGLQYANQVAPLAQMFAAMFAPKLSNGLSIGAKIINISQDAVNFAEQAATSGGTKLDVARASIVAAVTAEKKVADALGGNKKLDQIIEYQLKIAKLAAEVQAEVGK